LTSNTQDVLLLVLQISGTKLMPPLQLSAATGGVSAALVSSLLHVFNQGSTPVPSLTCQDLFPGEIDRWHLPSLCAGVILGFFLAYLFEYLTLLKLYLQLQLRQKTAAFVNSAWIRGRIG